MMDFMPFYINCTEWAGGAQILAGTTPNTFFFIYDWYFNGVWVVCLRWHHQYSSNGAMACAIPTFLPVGEWDAIFAYPHRMAYMYCRFFGNSYRLYCTSRAHLGTLVAFGAAIPSFV